MPPLGYRESTVVGVGPAFAGLHVPALMCFLLDWLFDMCRRAPPALVEGESPGLMRLFHWGRRRNACLRGPGTRDEVLFWTFLALPAATGVSHVVDAPGSQASLALCHCRPASADDCRAVLALLRGFQVTRGNTRGGKHSLQVNKGSRKQDKHSLAKGV